MAQARAMTRSARTMGMPIGVAVGVVLLLEMAARAGAFPITVPAPSAVLAEFLGDPNVLFSHMVPTIVAASTGYAIAAIIAVLAASIATAYAVTYGPIYNIGVSIHSIPLIAATPLLVVWLGTGPPTRIVIAVLASYFPMLVGAMQGFRATDPARVELFHVISANRWQRFRYLLLPSALPYLFAGFKIAAPSAILGAIISEWTGAERGMGVMMIYALFAFDVAKVWLSVVAACVMAATAYGLWALAERWIIFWERATVNTDD